MKRIFSICTVLVILIGACSPAAAPETQHLSMTFMPGYKPQANLPFVGAYVAQEKGYFAAENLDVNIQHSPGKGEHLQLVTTGKVQVTTQDAAVLLQRRAEPGLPLVSIALIGQRGQQAFAALKSSGLKTPKDWEGHTVGFKGTPPPDLDALILAAGGDPERVERINVGFDPRVLSEGKVDVYPVFKSNEPYLLKKWGYDLTLWAAEDFNIPSLGLTYVTSEETLRDHPETLTRFLRACLKGIDYAAAHPDEAVQIVMAYAGPETDPEHMRFMLDRELADARPPGGEAIGWQSETQWIDLADFLTEAGVMPALDAKSAFSNAILTASRRQP